MLTDSDVSCKKNSETVRLSPEIATLLSSAMREVSLGNSLM